MKSRRIKGTSLIETLVILAIGGIVATLAIKLLHQSQLNARQAQQWLDLQRGVMQLETQLRQDLRDADGVELPDEETLVIRLPDSSISYKKEKGLIERQSTVPGSDQVRREGYRLPRSRISISQDDSSQVRVMIEANQGLPSSEEYVIEQTIGRRP